MSTVQREIMLLRGKAEHFYFLFQAGSAFKLPQISVTEVNKTVNTKIDVNVTY